MKIKIGRLVVLASVLCLGAACTTDGSGEGVVVDAAAYTADGGQDAATGDAADAADVWTVCDPTGIFPIDLTRTTGQCPDSWSNVLYIYGTPSAWWVSDSDGVVHEGTIEQSTDQCSLSLRGFWTIEDVTGTVIDVGVDHEITIDNVSGSMTGSAVQTLSDAGAVLCFSEYSVSGQRQ
jgi:hypothetical protein